MESTQPNAILTLQGTNGADTKQPGAVLDQRSVPTQMSESLRAVWTGPCQRSAQLQWQWTPVTALLGTTEEVFITSPLVIQIDPHMQWRQSVTKASTTLLRTAGAHDGARVASCESAEVMTGVVSLIGLVIRFYKQPQSPN